MRRLKVRLRKPQFAADYKRGFRRGQCSPRTSAPARRGPSVHRYNIGTWGAYHAARIAVSGAEQAYPGEQQKRSEAFMKTTAESNGPASL